MIQSIHIQNFKSIENQVFDFKPLTILTGANSSGKSSVIQAILLYAHYTARREESYKSASLKQYIDNLGNIKSLAYKNAKENMVVIKPTINNKNMALLSFDIYDGNICLVETEKEQMLIFEENLYYISANRIGQENQSQSSENDKCGVNGEYIFGFYEENKNTRLRNEKLLLKDDKDFAFNGESLSAQVSIWLNKILDLRLIPRTEKRNNTKTVELVYENNDLDNFHISPFNLGAGVSYLTKILILGLSLKEDDILIIENPEVHLHPKAISGFAEFFAFLVKGGIQVILETHSEHIINKMRYFVFKNKLSTNDVQIYYREKFNREFIAMGINKDGKYIDNSDKVINFPAGFFDSVLKDLLEMF